VSIALFIYLADLCGSISGLCGAICIVCAIVLLICLLTYASNHEAYCKTDPNIDKTVFKYVRISVVTAFVAALLGTFLPSTNTMYMIAGVEAAKSVTETPEFQKTRQLLNNKLDDLLKEKK